MEKALGNLSKSELIALINKANTKSASDKLIYQKSNEILALDKDKLTLDKEKLQCEYDYLKYNFDQLRRLVFGSKRERFIPENNPHQAELPFKEWSVDTQKIEEPSLPEEIISYKRQKTKRKIGALALPSHLPINEIWLEPTEKDLENRVKIGEEITDKLEITPSKLFINRYIRPKYALKKDIQDEELNTESDIKKPTVIMADLPSFAIEKSFASNSLLTQIFIDKFADHLPFYRQISRYKREGVELSDSTVSRWQSNIGQLLEPLYLAMKKMVLEQGYIQADESTIPVLDKNKKGKTHTGYHWVYYSPLEKMVLFDYRKSRNKEGPKEMLQHFKGYLQTDGYAGYDQFFNREDISILGCMAHARRYFEKALDQDQSRAKFVMEQIQNLYRIERYCKDEKILAKARYDYRLKYAQPILENLLKYLLQERTKVLPKSPIGKAIEYSLKRWTHLMKYLMDGKLEIDNNLVEGTIRNLAIGRKNYLFAGSHDAAKVAAMFYSFFGTCKKHDVNPQKWLKKVLDIIPDYNAQKLHELFPQNLNLED